jgi:hypothetical protein
MPYGQVIGRDFSGGLEAARSIPLKAKVLDAISRDLGEGATRRGFLRILGGLTAAAVGAVGASGLSEPAAARRRGRKRGKRRTASPEQGQTEQSQLPGSDSEAAKATSIPPNCIYVCCDGTCDSWKMCLKCVKWPNPPTTGTIAIS